MTASCSSKASEVKVKVKVAEVAHGNKYSLLGRLLKIVSWKSAH